MSDKFKSHTLGLDSPFTRLEAPVTSDTLELQFFSRAVYTKLGGAVKLVMASEWNRSVRDEDAAVAVTVDLTPGWHNIRVAQIFTTGTTATDLFIAD